MSYYTVLCKIPFNVNPWHDDDGDDDDVISVVIICLEKLFNSLVGKKLGESPWAYLDQIE